MKLGTWFISFALAVTAVLSFLEKITLPPEINFAPIWIMTAAVVLVMLGNIFKVRDLD